MYIDTQELCERLKLHYNTVYRLIKSGMPHVKIGHTYRFDLDKVVAWLNERHVKELS